MGETRVDLYHLLEDLRDTYAGSAEETILTEVLANALDSKADTIHVMASPITGSLTIVDNGRGMSRRELERFHDMATSSKTRGSGIGFAGVGVKLSLLEASEVVTETRCNGRPVATSWRLASRRRAPWEWVQPPGLVGERGTAVQLHVSTALSPLLDEGFIETVLRRHFAPLLDPAFEAVLGRYYPRGVRITLNGRGLPKGGWSRSGRIEEIVIKLPRRHLPAGVGYLVQSENPLPEDQRGIGVSAFGKVISRGWEWLGVSCAAPDTIGGLIEVPDLADCLQTNKAGFIRGGRLGEKFLRYREAIQEVVDRQLHAWGVKQGSNNFPDRRVVRPYERDLEKVLGSLASDFPLLGAISDAKLGGQYRLLGGSPGSQDRASGSIPVVSSEGRTTLRSPEPGGPSPEGVRENQSAVVDEAVHGRRRRRGRLQIGIRFEVLPDSTALSRLTNAVVWVNQAHPAYRRSQSSRSTGYHVALACCLALAPLAAPDEERAFMGAFLARWGEGMPGGKLPSVCSRSERQDTKPGERGCLTQQMP
jgi:hypothetical protein